MAKTKTEPNLSGLHAESLRFGYESPINIYGNPAAAEAANEVIHDVLTAIDRAPDDDKAVRALSRLVANFDWVLQLAEMHEYLNWLVRRRLDNVVRRLINDPQHRGRQHTHKAYLVHLVRATISAENDAGKDCSNARAARLVAEQYGPELGTCNADTVKSDYCRYADEYDRLRAGQFVGKEWLANTKWKLTV